MPQPSQARTPMSPWTISSKDKLVKIHQEAIATIKVLSEREAAEACITAYYVSTAM